MIKRVVVEMADGKDVIITPIANVKGRVDMSYIDMTLDMESFELIPGVITHFQTPRRTRFTLSCESVNLVIVDHAGECPHCHRPAMKIQQHWPSCPIWLEMPEDKRPAGWGLPGAARDE